MKLFKQINWGAITYIIYSYLKKKLFEQNYNSVKALLFTVILLPLPYMYNIQCIYVYRTLITLPNSDNTC